MNDRARDVVDLLLLRDLTETTGHPPLTEIRVAVKDVFAVRAAEADATGGVARAWPARLTAHPHWEPSHTSAAGSAAIAITMADAVEQVNAWLNRIGHA